MLLAWLPKKAEQESNIYQNDIKLGITTAAARLNVFTFPLDYQKISRLSTLALSISISIIDTAKDC